MQLIVDIKNDSIADKIKSILSVFKNDGVEIYEPETSNQKEGESHGERSYPGVPEAKLTDEYIKEHWRELVMTNHSNPDYYKSEQYKIDRASDWEERGKI